LAFLLLPKKTIPTIKKGLSEFEKPYCHSLVIDIYDFIKSVQGNKKVLNIKS